MSERGDVGALRRAQIVEAASRVIARRGFHNATLAEVEAEAGISRGMMTYHFPTKDAMIAAVFESTLERLRDRGMTPPGATASERIDAAIDSALAERPSGREFLGLHFTFLALASNRDDYRAALAAADRSARDRLARDLIEVGNDPEGATAKAEALLAALRGVAALLHVDPDGFDPETLASTLKGFARTVRTDQMV